MTDENTFSRNETDRIPSTASQPPTVEEAWIENVYNKVANKVLARLNGIEDAIKARYEQVDRLNDENKRELEAKLEQHKKAYTILNDETMRYRVEIADLNEEVESLKHDKNILEKSARTSLEEACEAKRMLEAERRAFHEEKLRLEEKHKMDLATMEQTASTDMVNYESEKNAMAVEHKAEIEKLQQEYESTLAKKDEELEARCETAINDCEEKLDVVRSKIEKVMPREVCNLFGYQEDADDSEDSRRRLQCVYSFMWLLSGPLDKNVFVKRFRTFDTAFAEAMDSDRATLEKCRRRVERYLNDKLKDKNGDCTISVCWPCERDCFDKATHMGNENARTILYAHSAYVMCLTDGKTLECLSRAGVDAK